MSVLRGMSINESPADSPIEHEFSDKEDAEQLDLSQFEVDWIDLSCVGFAENKLGISSLPGSKFKKIWRSLPSDIKCLKDTGIEDVFCLCTKGELNLYRVPSLLDEYTEAGLNVHHYPVDDGTVPPVEVLVKILEDVKQCLVNNKKTLVHCFGGYGRSCLVVMCLYIYLDKSIDIEKAREKVQEVRGDKALGSVKQYNCVTDFHSILEAYRKDKVEDKDDRCASR